MNKATVLIDFTEVQAGGRVCVERGAYAEERSGASIQTGGKRIGSLSLSCNLQWGTVVVDTFLDKELDAVDGGLV